MDYKISYVDNKSVNKLRTPLDIINIIGSGGIKMGTITEVWGPPKCFVGSTKVKLLDGTSRTLKELSEITDTFEVYSYDLETNKVVPGIAKFSGSHFTKKGTVKVTIECDKKVTRVLECTPDHLWLLSNGEYIQAQELSPGDSLMCMQWKSRKGIDEVKSTSDGTNKAGYIPSHWLSAYRQLDMKKFISEGFEVHHIDGNRMNNSYDNLLVMKTVDHARLHGLQNPDKITRASREYWNSTQSEEFRSRLSQSTTDRNNTRWKEHREGGRRYGKIPANHTVVSVESTNNEVEVFDIDVDKYNNFCIDLELTSDELGSPKGRRFPHSGIFVHNSGKSTFSYQTASMFLEDYPTGELHILDGETSTDDDRMEYTFGIEKDGKHKGRVHVVPGSILEDSFNYINRLCAKLQALKKEGKEVPPQLVIWDTIAVAVSRTDYENAVQIEEDKQSSSMFKGGQMMKPRVIKHFMSVMTTAMFQLPITVFILNQITTEMHQYGSRTTSSGGLALKHNIHMRMEFKQVGKHMSADGKLGSQTESHMSMDKSKFFPILSNIKVFIDDTEGGRIVPGKEAFIFAAEAGLIQKNGGWYRIPGIDKPYQMSTIEKMIQDIRPQICSALHDYFRQNKLIDFQYRKLGIPNFGTYVKEAKNLDQMVQEPSKEESVDTSNSEEQSV